MVLPMCICFMSDKIQEVVRLTLYYYRFFIPILHFCCCFSICTAVIGFSFCVLVVDRMVGHILVESFHVCRFSSSLMNFCFCQNRAHLFVISLFHSFLLHISLIICITFCLYFLFSQHFISF